MEITRREFVVTKIETLEHVYHVKAETKEEAIQAVFDCNWDSSEVRFVEDGEPVLEEIIEYDACPNKGEGWSSIPLEQVEQVLEDRPEVFDGIIPLWKDGKSWHYNGLCDGEKLVGRDMCYHCLSAQEKGYRLLSNEEKKYLNRAYGKKLNVQE